MTLLRIIGSFLLLAVGLYAARYGLLGLIDHPNGLLESKFSFESSQMGASLIFFLIGIGAVLQGVFGLADAFERLSGNKRPSE